VTDNPSLAFYGSYLDGVITDETIFDQQTAVRRCRQLLLEQSKGLTTLTLSCWKAGLVAGHVLRVDHTVRNIHDSFIIQEVRAVPLGAGHFRYDITLGAWNWNLVDVVLQLARAANPSDETSNLDATPISIQQAQDNLTVAYTLTKSTYAMGEF